MTESATERLLRLTQRERAMTRLLRLTFSDPSNFTQGAGGRLTGSVKESSTGTYDKVPTVLQPYARAGDKVYQSSKSNIAMVLLQHKDGSTHSAMKGIAMAAVGSTPVPGPGDVMPDQSDMLPLGTLTTVPENAGVMATPALDAAVADLRTAGWENVDLAGLASMPAAAQTGVVAALTQVQADYPAAEPSKISVGPMAPGADNVIAATTTQMFGDGSSSIVLNQDYFGPDAYKSLSAVGASSAASGHIAMPADWKPSSSDFAQYVTTHELGHAVDNWSGYSASKAGSTYLTSALTAPGDEVSNYAESSKGELVAESFAVSMLSPTTARGDAAAVFTGLSDAYTAKLYA